MSLPPVRRVITGHADDGFAKFQSDAADWAADEAQGKNFAGRPDLFDVPGISCRAIDIPPGAESNMHRTLTFDFVAVIKGSVLLKLDSGEEKTLESGDIVLQKGTNHAWTNPHPTEWARLYVVVTKSLPIR
ncbi:hypothetical protein B0H14DRAFT_2752613 [Mycena olivaceomarginata]|nr:hypothetical protein B0H14DRAFT_2752613 [Mycena olivaceomarginata]